MDLPASFVLIRDSKIILWYQLMTAPEKKSSTKHILQSSWRNLKIFTEKFTGFLQGSWRNLQDFYRVPREVHRIFTGFLEKFTGFLQDSWRNLKDFYRVTGEIYRIFTGFLEKFTGFLQGSWRNLQGSSTN